MKVERPGEANGFVCFDDHGRATVDFAGIPQIALGKTLEVIFGCNWFDEGPDGIGAAPPGTYNWDDDATYAEFEIKVEADATASICMYLATSRNRESRIPQILRVRGHCEWSPGA
ncbi:hypothetical protein [Streptomyces sp. NPDC005784]|uniref:hypothetical protein n=1 Tax=Streptomyces sp. NPDC005784 TaxID=3364731 RepID=UPI0036970B2A